MKEWDLKYCLSHPAGKGQSCDLNTSLYNFALIHEILILFSGHGLS